jgi:hypothetical protein
VREFREEAGKETGSVGVSEKQKKREKGRGGQGMDQTSVDRQSPVVFGRTARMDV